jgi:hypothetical protein
MSDEEQFFSNAERLARAVLLFHSPSWEDERRLWQAITGEDEANAQVLCDLADRTLAEEEHPGALDERVIMATRLLADYHERMARDSSALDDVDYHTDLVKRMRLEINRISRRRTTMGGPAD